MKQEGEAPAAHILWPTCRWSSVSWFVVGLKPMCVIENPESHIHPEGQSKLMELICRAAKAGVQFIIETHSDHIINGLLVALKKGVVAPSDSRLYFFDRDLAGHSTITRHLHVLEGGRIRTPPEGFFDRLDKDMEILTGF